MAYVAGHSGNKESLFPNGLNLFYVRIAHDTSYNHHLTKQQQRHVLFER